MADFFVHESSYVDDGAQVGRGTKIWHFCHVMPGAVIGERCNLGQNVVVMPGTRIGNNVKIQNNVSIYEGVTLEDDVFCGPSCVFTNVLNPRSHVSRKREYRLTRVKRGSSIGANATILCGVTLGEYAFIGAGAVVTSDVPAYAREGEQSWLEAGFEKLPDEPPEVLSTRERRYAIGGQRVFRARFRNPEGNLRPIQTGRTGREWQDVRRK